MTTTTLQHPQRLFRCFRALSLAILLTTAASAQQAPPQVNWIGGDYDLKMTVADLGQLAQVDVPIGYLFANGDDTQKLMQYLGNVVSGTEVGLLMPEAEEWFAVFEYSATGYVSDDDQDALDAEEMLEALIEGNERANDYRRERGFGTLEIVGWETEPRYDDQTHNLEWATRCQEEDGSIVINHNVRLLGRRGIMEVMLVVDAEALPAALPQFRQRLEGFSFKSGYRYAEFQPGDKVAEYGLAALVVGGAAAKSGLFKHLGKWLLLAGIAVASLFKRVFGRESAPQV